MSGEDKASIGQLGKAFAHSSGHFRDELRVVEELAQLGKANLRVALLCYIVAQLDDVLVVLQARRVAAPGGGGEDQDVGLTRCGELVHGLGAERVPVAVAKEDRQVQSARGEFSLDMGNELAV